MDITDTIEQTIGAAFKVGNSLGNGFLESVYENALCIELNKLNIQFKCQHPIVVWYEGQAVGEFKADFLVEKKLILEIKAVARLAVAHEIQLVHYLKATGIDHGLLINFGDEKVEIRRKFRTAKPTSNPTPPLPRPKAH